MLAKSHVGIGFLGGILLKGPLSLSVGPAALLLILFNLAPGIARYLLLVGLSAVTVTMPDKTATFVVPLALMAGCLFPDLDHPNSTLSAIIAPTESVLRMMTGAAGVVMIYFSYPAMLGMIAGVGMVIAAFLNVKIVPTEKLQRLMLIIGGVALILFDYGVLGNVLGGIYVFMGILSHRGLTHSLEGLLIASVAIWIFATKVGYVQIVAPFVLGYALHLLADLITNTGIYVSYFGKVKLGIPLVNTSGITDRIISIGTVAIALMLALTDMQIIENILKVVQ